MNLHTERLLKACYELLARQHQTPFLLNLLEEEIEINGVRTDGTELMETIADELELEPTL